MNYKHLPFRVTDPAHVKYAKDVRDTWAHLSESDCYEQVDAHMESEGFTQAETDEALEAAFGYVSHIYTLTTRAPA